MGKPAARLTDMHTCPMVTGVVPHVGGPILPACAPTVLTGKLPQARISDMALCVGPPDVIAQGAMTVIVMGMPAARMGDMTAHGGVIVAGFPTVLIGDNNAAVGGTTTQSAVNLPPGVEGSGLKTAPMVNTLKAAAKEGKPFCEQCTQAASRAAGHGN